MSAAVRALDFGAIALQDSRTMQTQKAPARKVEEKEATKPRPLDKGVSALLRPVRLHIDEVSALVVAFAELGGDVTLESDQNSFASADQIRQLKKPL
jgi:hypothetical protein